NAPQPSTLNRLDTGDARFVNASPQLGNEVWNIHSINVGGFAGIRWYRINHVTNSVVQQGTLPSGTNSVFNASIAVNDASAAFVTFTLSSGAVRPQVRFTGKTSAEVAMPLGGTILTSPASFTTCSTSPCRWGDYSS